MEYAWHSRQLLSNAFIHHGTAERLPQGTTHRAGGSWGKPRATEGDYSARIDKAGYQELCRLQPSIPIFSQPWWLDATSGEKNWDAVVVRRADNIVAAIPYAFKQRTWGLELGMPPLTQKLGPWIVQSEMTRAHAAARYKELCDVMIAGLPKYSRFYQSFDYTFVNWLPFYWQGFSQTTRYTYVLENTWDEDALWRGLHSNVRQKIRRAVDRYGLVVQHDLPLETFFAVVTQTFRRQRLKAPVPYELMRRIHEACAQRGCNCILFAQDSSRTVHAALYLLCDAQSVYCFMGGADPNLRRSGAQRLLLWEAIRFASRRAKSFDFCGSMLDTVEPVFRSFGGAQKAYFSITHVPSPILRLRGALSEIRHLIAEDRAH